jgi:hypothetical protein
MLILSEFKDLLDYKQLDEKLIMYNNGARYGQIVFLAGGAGSGKGFAIKNFMEGEKFKVRDVDEFKKAYLKLNELTKRYDELKGLNLKTPEDVFKLHAFVKRKGIKDNTLNMMLNDLKQMGSARRGTLPNILFDITLKEVEDITEVLPILREVGYQPTNIHITWVLTNFKTAIVNNRERSRVVPEDILLGTHEGARDSMIGFIRNQLPRGVNGQVNVILNNPELTVPYVGKDGKPIMTKPREGKKSKITIKDFTYLRMKKEGKPFEKDASIKRQVFEWIKSNTPGGELMTLDVD